jgi:hypothetical protein
MKSVLCITLLLLFPAGNMFSQGNVYLVLGSDTAIWEGMDVSNYQCTYALSLFTDPARNAARVMDPGFRLPLRDSYGTPVKLTWWMMAGNIFRYATNTNIPNPNTMTLHLMKKYQGESIRSWGDELTLHYHTFTWTDYDGDGRYYWNQALSFPETADDFDVTLAEMLLEEETFPVSFRSGWHAMDNSWQQRLDTLLPYSMHNDWPARRVDVTEPLDNTFDWSRAPSTFVPFHPSVTDYQVPGGGRGWNVRSAYMSGADSSFMEGIFQAAAGGTNQVACLWAHLPETDFLDNVRKVDASAHAVALRHPNVRFRYCTAVEAMQLWRATADTLRPQLAFVEIPEGEAVRWSVSSDEPLFQPAPFIAVKDRYGEYRVVPCQPTGERSWETAVSFPRSDLAKAGAAATDTAGNLALGLIRYLPDDIFIDNTDAGFVERAGTWTSPSAASWGTSSRAATLGPADSASAEWTATIPVSGMYGVFAQIPLLGNPVQRVTFRLLEDGQPVAAAEFTAGVPTNRWVHLGTRSLSSAARNSVEMIAHGGMQSGMAAAADVIKYSALVRDRWLQIPEAFDAGEVIVELETARRLILRNGGIQPVVITSVASVLGLVSVLDSIPLTIPPMGEVPLDIGLRALSLGVLQDTLVIHSDDPRHLRTRTAITGMAVNYFAIVDDRDSLTYAETGAWNFSVARAYGTTSRFAYPAPGVSARYSAKLDKAGLYRIQEIVPTTVNASVRARYLLHIDDLPVDSAFVDQNAGSGSWVTVLERAIPAGSDVRLEITDAMIPVISGKVLRADAIRFQWTGDGATGIDEEGNGLPAAVSLDHNYPNPFNHSTLLSYQLSVPLNVKLAVYDVIGREVALLVDERKPAGEYRVEFNAAGLASGVYIYRLQAGGFVQTGTMILIR